jgi:hypothetical protein
MLLVEKQGRPTISLVANSFLTAWRTSAASWGQPHLGAVVLPTAIAGQSVEYIYSLVDVRVDAIVQGLTGAIDYSASVVAESAEESITVEADDLDGLSAAVNRVFLDRTWSDGFPIVPPTPGAVARMLTGTTRDPHEVISVIEPEFGEASVEKIAINAVMAGCKPAHLPVVIATIQALSQPQCILREMQVSTSPQAPLIVVNGPLATELSINAGKTTLGPGSLNHANSVIGRAVRLCLMNIGGSTPEKADINTLGMPAKYSLCLAENEAASPWPPYHVDRGYKPEESTVTAVTVLGMAVVSDIWSATPERLLDTVGSALLFKGSVAAADWLVGGKVNPATGQDVLVQHTLILAPDHARMIAEAGWTKADVRRYIHRTGRLPMRTFLDRGSIKRDEKGVWRARPDLQWLENHPDLEVPVLASADSLLVFVAGGTGNISLFFWGVYGSGTQRIET